MKIQTIYQLDEEDFDKVLERKLSDLSQKAAFARFENTLVSVDTVAEIHGIHRDTVLSYAKSGLIECQHIGKLWKFQLSYVLSLNFHDLKKRKAIS